MSNSLGAAAGTPVLSCAGSLAGYPGSSGRLLVGSTCGNDCRSRSDPMAMRAAGSPWRPHSPAASSGGKVLGIWALLTQARRAAQSVAGTATERDMQGMLLAYSLSTNQAGDCELAHTSWLRVLSGPP